MPSLRRPSLATKLALSFALIALAVTAAFAVLSASLGDVRRAFGVVTEREQPKAAAAYEMEINTLGFGLAVFKYIEEPNPEYRARAADDQQDFNRFKARYDRLATSGAEQRLSREVGRLHSRFIALGARMMDERDRQQRRLRASTTGFKGLDYLLDERLEEGRDPLEPGASPRVVAAGVLESQVVEFGTWLHAYLLSGEAAHRALVANNAADVRRAVRTLEQGAQSARQRADLQSFKRAWATLHARARAMIAARDHARRDTSALVALRTRLDDLLDEEIQHAASAAIRRSDAAADDSVGDTLRFMLAGLIGLLLLSALIALGAVRAAMRPIRRLSEAARAIAGGHFEHRVPVTSSDELGRLASQFNQMAITLDATTVSKRLLEEREEQLQVTLDSIGDGVITTDVDGLVRYLNPVAERLTGFGVADARGAALGKIYRTLEESTRQRAYCSVAPALLEDRATGDDNAAPKLLVRRDGTEFAIRESAAPIHDRDGEVTGVVLVFRDVTAERAAERHLAYEASHDPLTGLANRREFERALEQALHSSSERGRESVLCFIDLDRFKIVNDTCGHAAGDELLRMIAGVLGRRLRSADTLARLGGDEFGVLLADCTPGDGVRAAEGLVAAMNAFDQFTWEGQSFDVGASIGVVALTEGWRDVGDAMRAADAACYAAKEKGRGRVEVFQASESEFAERRGHVKLVSGINAALEDDRFVLYQQKIAPLRDRGDAHERYELLLRMVGEDGAIVGPDVFLPTAERFGLMPLIDRVVVTRAFAGLARRYAEGDYDRLGMCTINLSGATFGDELFLAFVQTQLDRFGVPPGKLCFEITETAAIANLAGALGTIEALRALGCRFAMDDFGSGLSSLANLRKLPVDYLKIDGALVRNVADDPVARAMITAVTQLASALGIETIAEFAEDDRTIGALHTLGVDYAQGYGIERPRPFGIERARRFAHEAPEPTVVERPSGLFTRNAKV